MAGGPAYLPNRAAAALRTARRLLARERASLLADYCLRDKRGKPMRQTMNKHEMSHVRSYDRAIDKIDEALE